MGNFLGNLQARSSANLNESHHFFGVSQALIEADEWQPLVATLC